MQKYIEIDGNTIAAAIQDGLNKLDLTLDKVETLVIKHPKAGFFGIGACRAKVRLTVKEDEKPEVIKQPKTETKDTKEKHIPKPQNIKEKAQQNEKSEPKAQQNKEHIKEQENQFEEVVLKTDLTVNDQKAKEFVDTLLVKMGIEGVCNVTLGTDREINLNISGNNMGNVIGRRGDTLDAIQYITNLVVKNNNEQDVKILIDCENYRIKRKLTLEKLALKMGHKVLKYKKHMTLEPMNPYERRMIHEVLQNFRGVHTYSTGKEPNRRVVIGFGDGKTEK